MKKLKNDMNKELMIKKVNDLAIKWGFSGANLEFCDGYLCITLEKTMDGYTRCDFFQSGTTSPSLRMQYLHSDITSNKEFKGITINYFSEEVSRYVKEKENENLRKMEIYNNHLK
jgi:hypothetical protein